MNHRSIPLLTSTPGLRSRSLPRRAELVGLFAWVLTMGCAAAVAQSDEQRLEYTLSFPAAAQHYVDVQLEFTTTDSTVEIMMPVWTPGSYLIREYPRFVQDL